MFDVSSSHRSLEVSGKNCGGGSLMEMEWKATAMPCRATPCHPLHRSAPRQPKLSPLESDVYLRGRVHKLIKRTTTQPTSTRSVSTDLNPPIDSCKLYRKVHYVEIPKWSSNSPNQRCAALVDTITNARQILLLTNAWLAALSLLSREGKDRRGRGGAERSLLSRRATAATTCFGGRGVAADMTGPLRMTTFSTFIRKSYAEQTKIGYPEKLPRSPFQFCDMVPPL